MKKRGSNWGATLLRILPGTGALVIALLFLSACMPPGPRALLKGKAFLEAGHYTDAVVQLETATSLLHTNAQAWNYLGLAYHHSGRGEEALKAYQRALTLDRTLAEARYNLGCLYLERNNLEEAKSALTAFTLDRENSPDGYLKLGTILTRSGDFVGAEKAFQQVLRFTTNSPEALTGLGVIRQKRGRGIEAAQFFASALKEDPRYGPALMNYGIVAQGMLQDRALAVEQFQRYLALNPAPPHAQAVSNLLSQLQQPRGAASGASLAGRPPVNSVTQTAASAVLANAAPATAPRLSASSAEPSKQPLPASKPVTSRPTEGRSDNSVATNKPVSSPPAERVVRSESAALPPEAVLRAAEAAKPPSGKPTLKESAAGASDITNGSKPRRGFLQSVNPLNLFGGKAEIARTNAPPSVVPVVSDASVPAGPRYKYFSPSKPVKGNSTQAEQVFSLGLKAYREHRLTEAMEAYRRATQLDPAFFSAHFYLGLACAEAGDLPLAARSYESALAIRPDSADARFNLALLLKQMGYPIDCAAQLERLIIYYPRDARAHITLGNVYAQHFKNIARAREHYLKALEADPKNPQAGAMRYWLTDHPQ